MTSKLLNLSFW